MRPNDTDDDLGARVHKRSAVPSSVEGALHVRDRHAARCHVARGDLTHFDYVCSCGTAHFSYCPACCRVALVIAVAPCAHLARLAADGGTVVAG